MPFSREFIEEVKRRSEIEDVVGKYVRLKRAGSNVVGLCPFHNEKTPSFTVFPQTNSFYCFGCGAGGDVFSFITVSYTHLDVYKRQSSRTRIYSPLCAPLPP